MKNVKFNLFSVGLVLAMALILSCSEAQAACNEKRIIGTWATVEEDGSDGKKWVFNSDGTGTFGNNLGIGRYAFVDGKLAIIGGSVHSLSISTDGRTARKQPYRVYPLHVAPLLRPVAEGSEP